MLKSELIERFNPEVKAVDFESSFAIGDGNFAFNADITGFQTLSNEYMENHNPLCIMSNWGWHSSKKFNRNELVEDIFEYKGRELKYAVNSEPVNHITNDVLLKNDDQIKANQNLYNTIRQNAHRANLGNLSLIVNDRIPSSNEIKNIYQNLDLLSGIINSKYSIDDYQFEVQTFCSDTNTVHFRIESLAVEKKAVKLLFTVKKPGPRIDGIDEIEEVLFEFEYDFKNGFTQLITVDDLEYEIIVQNCLENNLENSKIVDFSVQFRPALSMQTAKYSSNEIINFKKFWEQVDVPNLINNPQLKEYADQENLEELQRRVILSIYNLRIHSLGKLPPQETGLMCNSWYGKFHLEMHVWHSLWAPIYNLPHLLIESLNWYSDIRLNAKRNAQKNGFKGYRWPKMVDYLGFDSPSIIAVLLIWQQTHIIEMLEAVYQKLKKNEQEAFLEKWWDILKGTLDFVCDYLEYDDENKKWNIPGPLIPGQEEFDPTTVKNPSFELAYWKDALLIGEKWANRLKDESVSKISVLELEENGLIWKSVAENIALPKYIDDLYLSHELAPDTFPNFMKDHPLQLGIWSFFENRDVENDQRAKDALKNTLNRVLQDWDEQSMWGWDYGYMAMLANNLGDKKLAIDILLKKCPKNYYAKNGHNYQLGRTDLPSYLPGNGSLLLAIANLGVL